MNSQSTSPAATAGFSLIEVMIALTVLVGALMIIVGQHANVASLQRQTQQNASIDRIVQTLVNRVNAETYGNLATINAPWSIARYETLDGSNLHLSLGDTSADGRDPMTALAADPLDNLVDLGLTRGQDVPDDLRIYFEYYRAKDFTDPSGTQEGLLEAKVDGSQEFKTRAYVSPAGPVPVLKTKWRLAGWDEEDTSVSNSPGMLANVMDPTHPLLIRIIAVWEDQDPSPTIYRPVQRRELFTARAP